MGKNDAVFYDWGWISDFLKKHAIKRKNKRKQT